jgi:putative MATE family efflux protein
METITNKTISVYFQYAIPSILGMLAISSAYVVDGFFVGNYVGASGLGAINIAMPIFSVLFGVGLMLGIGSSVVSGKLLAEGDIKSASVMFSKTLIAVVVLSLVIIAAIYLLLETILIGFGATGQLLEDTTIYITTFLAFIPFLMAGIVLDYFVKIDGKPALAFWALLLSAVINILLDWLLIVYFGEGIFGAALATGLSQIALILVLLPHFFSKSASIKFVKPVGKWLTILKAASNGSSEFINETSVGMTALIFNYIMLKSFGVEGVAAYAVISYIIWFSIMISFGISDSLQPIISKNFGAKQPRRIADFLKYALISVLLIGIAMSLVLIQIPEVLASFFIESNDSNTIEIVLSFASIIWPMYIFSGVNMVISAYFTAIHKPIQSVSIALLRSLFLPIIFIYILPQYFGNKGIYMAIPVAEFITMLLAITLYFKLTPSMLLAQETTPSLKS